jgi:hypothetical protein
LRRHRLTRCQRADRGFDLGQVPFQEFDPLIIRGVIALAAARARAAAIDATACVATESRDDAVVGKTSTQVTVPNFVRC